MIKLVLFDLDGVLIDAKKIHYDALNEALGEQYAVGGVGVGVREVGGVGVGGVAGVGVGRLGVGSLEVGRVGVGVGAMIDLKWCICVSMYLCILYLCILYLEL